MEPPDPDDMPARRGRAARTNPPNRFERLHLVEDPAALEEDELRQVPTSFFVDATRSILAKNDSPDIPFTYSLNPYRGCEHGCAYCLDGDTRILMGDGSTRPLREVRVGDVIYGTKRDGWYRRYVKTLVLAHWATEKEAYRITLADGTILVASADHRFLTDRGWKYVIGHQQGAARRPHLTTRNKLMGTGAFTSTPDETEDYRQGYLCGVIRGDALLAHYSYDRQGRSSADQWQFRLALKDREPLGRTSSFLKRLGIGTHAFAFQAETARTAAMTGIRTHKRAHVETIEQHISWPSRPTDEWYRGFLSGIFDAEGNANGGVVRISNTDPAILGYTERGLSQLGFTFTYDAPRRSGHRLVRVIRVQGGIVDRLRFFHLVDPSIVRKREIAGTALKTKADLRVVSVEPLHEMRGMFDITTGTGDFIANGIVSHNCYARPGHEYLGYSAGLDFETKIVVKREAPELLAQALGRPSWKPEVVVLSGSTDPYQPAERRLRLTRGCLEVFERFRNPVSIITKNYLVTRDVDVLAALAERQLVQVTVSITSLRADLIGTMEPRTSRPERRLQAIAALAEAGVPVGVNVAPVIPGLTDEEMPAILEAAAAHGASYAGYIVLRLPGAVKPLFLDWLERTYPDRYPRVVNRLREIRGEALTDSRFGARMKGEGVWAELFGRLFESTCRRYGLRRKTMNLSTDHFRRVRPGQTELF